MTKDNQSQRRKTRDSNRMRKLHRAAWDHLPLALRDQAVRIFLNNTTDSERAIIRARARVDGQWFVGSHFGFGMHVRNLFRCSGLTDDQLPGTWYEGFEKDAPDTWPRNWDDFYVAVIEGAVGIYEGGPRDKVRD